MDKKDQLIEHIQNAAFFAARDDWEQCALALDEAANVAEELRASQDWMNHHHTPDTVLIAALRILAMEIQSDDGVANACIAEAADRLEDLSRKFSHLEGGNFGQNWYDGRS